MKIDNDPQKLSSFGNYKVLQEGTYTAETDGFAIGYTDVSGVGTVSSFARISCIIDDKIVIGAHGGRTIYGPDDEGGSAPASFTAPIAKGSTYQLTTNFPDANDVNPEVTYYWIPLS